MKFRFSIIILFISCNYFIQGCKENSSKRIQNVDIQNEIKKLKNHSDKENFLIEIYNSDQSIRKKEAKILSKFGRDSKEYQKISFEWDSIDHSNYQRIKLYLDKFKYPSIDSFSQNANHAPWLVIHHSGLEQRKKHFKILYEAYLNKDLKIDQFELYLTRTFQMEKGYYPKTEGVYQQDKKINDIIKELELM